MAPPPAPPSAQQLADRAYELHAAGDYAAAIAMYLRAYEASTSAVTLLNVATIYDRKLHEGQLASDYYRRYLRAPDAEPDLVQKATERLTALKQGQESASTRAPASPNAVDLAAPSRGRSERTVGIAVGATGLAGVGASLVLALLAKSKNDDANAICDGAACSTDEGVHLAHQAGVLATASTLSFFAGLGLAGGGLALILLAPRPSDSTSSPLALTVVDSPGGAGLGLRGAF